MTRAAPPVYTHMCTTVVWRKKISIQSKEQPCVCVCMHLWGRLKNVCILLVGTHSTQVRRLWHAEAARSGLGQGRRGSEQLPGKAARALPSRQHPKRPGHGPITRSPEKATDTPGRERRHWRTWPSACASESRSGSGLGAPRVRGPSRSARSCQTRVGAASAHAFGLAARFEFWISNLLTSAAYRIWCQSTCHAPRVRVHCSVYQASCLTIQPLVRLKRRPQQSVLFVQSDPLA